MSTVVFDSPETPRVTLSKVGDLFTAVVELDGLSPTRDPGAEEIGLGITSLDPPTVQARSHRALIEGCMRAVEGAATSSVGRGTPGQTIWQRFRVAVGVRGALRELGEDI